MEACRTDKRSRVVWVEDVVDVDAIVEGVAVLVIVAVRQRGFLLSLMSLLSLTSWPSLWGVHGHNPESLHGEGLLLLSLAVYNCPSIDV